MDTVYLPTQMILQSSVQAEPFHSGKISRSQCSSPWIPLGFCLCFFALLEHEGKCSLLARARIRMGSKLAKDFFRHLRRAVILPTASAMS